MIRGSIFVAIGVFVAVFNPKEYRSEAVLVMDQESGQKFGQSLSGLAGLAGLSLGADFEGELDPEIFSEYLTSNPFMFELLHKNFYYEALGDSISFEEYILEETRSSFIELVLDLPYTILDLFLVEKQESEELYKGYYFISTKKRNAINETAKRLQFKYDQDLNVISTNILLQDPVMSAVVLDYIIERMSNFIKEHVQEKKKRDFEFLSKQYNIKKNQYDSMTIALATYMDTNLALNTNSSRVKQENLKQSLAIAYNLFDNISLEKEKALIELNKSNPVFTTIQPASISAIASYPKKVKIIMAYSIIGLCLSIVSIELFTKQSFFPKKT